MAAPLGAFLMPVYSKSGGLLPKGAANQYFSAIIFILPDFVVPSSDLILHFPLPRRVIVSPAESSFSGLAMGMELTNTMPRDTASAASDRESPKQLESTASTRGDFTLIKISFPACTAIFRVLISSTVQRSVARPAEVKCSAR